MANSGSRLEIAAQKVFELTDMSNQVYHPAYVGLEENFKTFWSKAFDSMKYLARIDLLSFCTDRHARETQPWMARKPKKTPIRATEASVDKYAVHIDDKKLDILKKFIYR